MQRQATDLPCSAAFDHRRFTSRPVPFPAEYSACFVALSYGVLRFLTVLTPFHYVCHVMLRLSRRVKFNDIKWQIIGTGPFIL